MFRVEVKRDSAIYSICVFSAHSGGRRKTPNLLSGKTEHQYQKRAEGEDEDADVCVLTQQWRKPVDIGFTVRVQKRDDFSFGGGGAQQAGPDQPLPLLGPQNANLGQPNHVLLQRLLEVL